VERATGIGGVFVRSPHPDMLRARYAQHLGLELEDFRGAVLRSTGGETVTWAPLSLRLGHRSRRQPLRALGARRGSLTSQPGDVRLPAVDHASETVRPGERLRFAKERPLLHEIAGSRDPLEPR
jgi:hypothetical protein